MYRRWLAIVACAFLVGCASGDGDEQEAPERTRAEKDSIIGESDLPGAGGVRRALDVQERSRERAAEVDSLVPDP